ncbi:MAG: hypothetical protein M3T96_10930 [Acidobacteriota bacterium]|nr:hypothetical protein [Acidobacteriota bacterium]
MRHSILLFSAIFFIGCGTSESVSNTATNANANTIAVVVNNDANNPLAATKTPEAATVNNAPTVAPVVAAYYEALKKKDDAALQKIFSQATLKSYQADMKEENQKSLAKFITDLEPVPDKPFEARNETIEGDSIIAEMRGGSYPNGIKIKFVKENGAWKMTNESPEVKMSAAPSKSAM